MEIRTKQAKKNKRLSKLKKDKTGEEILEQYSMDFFGNSELVKKK